jgi:GNAT superfamily N-acetyltransferase
MATKIDTAILLRLAGDALIAFFRAAQGFEARVRREAWLVTTGGTGPFGNCITAVEPGNPAARTLREFIGLLRGSGTPGLVCLSPEADAGLIDVCADHGLSPEAPAPFMVCRVGELAMPRGSGAYRVEQIADQDSLHQAIALLAAAFGLPEESARRCLGDGLLAEPAVTLYGAHDGARMVSSVALSRLGSFAYVDIMATAPDRQRRGAGSAVLAHALAEHAAAGVRHVALVASEEGKPLYERFGFCTAFELPTWAIPVQRNG